MNSIDAYQAWLDISPHERPVNHYRLFGLPLLESNPEVISQETDRVIAYVEGFNTSEHAAVCGRLLDELYAARSCLLDPKAKSRYDKTLARQSSPNAATIKPAPPAPGSRATDGSGAGQEPALAAQSTAGRPAIRPNSEGCVGPAPPPVPGGSADMAASSSGSAIPTAPPVPGSTGATGSTTPAPVGPTASPSSAVSNSSNAVVSQSANRPAVSNFGAAQPPPTVPTTPMASPPINSEPPSAEIPSWAPEDRTGSVGETVPKVTLPPTKVVDTLYRRRLLEKMNLVFWLFGLTLVLAVLVVSVILALIT